jgi:PAS domain S-box-containing protein
MPTDLPGILSDPARLSVLRDARLDDSAPDAPFDRLARLAARLTGAPVAFISFLDETRQYFKGVSGVPEPLASAREAGLEHSVCKHVVGAGAPLCIEDVSIHPLTAGDPALAGLGVRAYASVPLVTRGGHAVGTFCLCDAAPRAWSPADLEVMRDLAAFAVDEVERRSGTSREAVAAFRSEALFRPLVEQSLAAIYLFQDGCFRYVNPRLAEVFGYPHAYFDVPRPVMDFVHPDDRERVAENVRRRTEGDTADMRYRFRGLHADGRLLHLEVHGSRVELDGRPALIGVGIDVTEQVRAEEARASALAVRDRFYAMMSHELRTPVSAIMLYNDLLASGVYEPLNPSQQEAVDRAQRSARHLLALINDLLDLSRLHAGKLETRVEDVDVAEVVESAAKELAPLALEEGCALEIDGGGEALVLASDRRRVHQIVVNLLANAFKYGRGQPVAVRCARDGDGVAVEVTDRGEGIAADDVDRIFEDFVQLGGAEGTGLGLPLARRLSEMLGGRLEVRSVPGQGSTFRLTLPAVPTPGAAPFRDG